MFLCDEVVVSYTGRTLTESGRQARPRRAAPRRLSLACSLANTKYEYNHRTQSLSGTSACTRFASIAGVDATFLCSPSRSFGFERAQLRNEALNNVAYTSNEQYLSIYVGFRENFVLYRKCVIEEEALFFDVIIELSHVIRYV